VAVNKHGQQRGVVRPLQLVGLFIALAGIWLMWSGIFKPLLFGLGVFSCILSVWMAQRMGFFRHTLSWPTAMRLPGYWWWVLCEIVKSSVDVAIRILKPSMPISPTVVELVTTEKTEAGKVILGNSITLSPGTVTIDVHKDRLLVHCLTLEGAQALQSLEAQRRTARLEIT
tara:strand:- start:69149 stop:69661 length:513 start_codon:yes stop_codon:yes gene_type:complete